MSDLPNGDRDDVSDERELPGGVLVVEDDDGLRGLEVTWLERALDQPVGGAATGTEAMERLDREAVAVLVLDRHLPDMGGHEIHGRLDETVFEGNVVVCSAVEPDERLNESNTAAYLTKPIMQDELVETVQRCLRDAVGTDRLPKDSP
jgi:DNA-binding response OmpR family regulator